MADKPVKRVLTGMRLTSQFEDRALHLGHYVGALTQWEKYLQDPNIECFFLLADVQSLGTHVNDPKLIERSQREVVLDWISAGIDPTRPNVHFVLQSQILSRSALFELFLSRATLEQMQRNPTVKAEMASLEKRGQPVNLLFLTHPVNQAADIMMVSPLPESGNQLLVPVGEDQLPLISFCRKIVNGLNEEYGPLLVEPESRTSDVPRLVGLYGPESGKMGKSDADSAIFMADSAAEVAAKVKVMYTDPNRPNWQDAGTPEGLAEHVPLVFHRAFNPDKDRVAELEAAYLQGGIKDSDIKNELTVVLNEMLDPIRERRHEAERNAYMISDFVYNGTYRANQIANNVLTRLQGVYCLPDIFGISNTNT